MGFYTIFLYFLLINLTAYSLEEIMFFFFGNICPYIIYIYYYHTFVWKHGICYLLIRSATDKIEDRTFWHIESFHHGTKLCTAYIHSYNCLITGNCDLCGNSKPGVENETCVIYSFLLHYN